MLTSNDLEYMRASIENNLLPETGILYRDIGVSDLAGGRIMTQGTAVAALRYRLDYTTVNWETMTGMVERYDGWVLSYPHDADVKVDDYLMIGGQKFEVIAIDPQKSWDAAGRAKVEIK